MLKNAPADIEAYHAFVSRRKEKLERSQAIFKLYSECSQSESSDNFPIETMGSQLQNASDAIDKLLKLQLSEKPDPRDLPFQSCRDLSEIIDVSFRELDSSDCRDVMTGSKRSSAGSSFLSCDDDFGDEDCFNPDHPSNKQPRCCTFQLPQAFQDYR